jgi:hypothetical protein
MVEDMDDPLNATLEEFAAAGFTHVECFCPRCRMTRLRPFSWLPRISIGPHHRAAFSEASLRGVRRSISLSETVAAGSRVCGATVQTFDGPLRALRWKGPFLGGCHPLV